MDDGQGITTTVNLKSAFADSASGVQLAANTPTVAISPSQMMNGGKMDATAANAKKIGLG